MNSDQFLEDVCLTDLGTGAGMVVWGFRSAARGWSGCPCVVRGFERLLGAAGGEAARHALYELAAILGHEGRRPISLAMPGSVRLVRDEALLLNACAAAYSGDSVARDACLAGLMAKIPSLRLSAAAMRLAESFRDAGLAIEAVRLDTNFEILEPALRARAGSSHASVH